MKSTYTEVLAAIRRAPMEMAARFFGKRREGRVSVSELLSLYLIDLLDGPTLKQYAEIMGISQPNATYKINVMAEKGYVEKRLSEEDRRQTHLYVTAKAQQLFVDSGSENLEQELCSRFTEDQLSTAQQVFETVVKFYSGKK